VAEPRPNQRAFAGHVATVSGAPPGHGASVLPDSRQWNWRAILNGPSGTYARPAHTSLPASADIAPAEFASTHRPVGPMTFVTLSSRYLPPTIAE